MHIMIIEYKDIVSHLAWWMDGLSVGGVALLHAGLIYTKIFFFDVYTSIL
jgi:hypothetical protein